MREYGFSFKVFVRSVSPLLSGIASKVQNWTLLSKGGYFWNSMDTDSLVSRKGGGEGGDIRKGKGGPRFAIVR